jgi:hypothetical protein
MVNITCGKCGHDADYFDFTVDGSGENLKNGHFRCPKCSHQWKLEKVGKPTFFESGFVPADRKIVEIAPGNTSNEN